MPRHVVFLTRTDRAVRRQKIVRLVKAGVDPAEVAATVGVSECWVKQVARDAGHISGPPGRRGFWPECPADLRPEYLRMQRKLKMPAIEVRRLLEERVA